MNPVTENALLAALPSLQDELTTEEVMELLEKEKGRAKGTVTNAVTILSYDPLLKDGFWFNELTQRIHVLKEMGWPRTNTGESFCDNDLYNAHLYCCRVYGNFSVKIIEEAIKIVANRHSYHPIRDFLNSLKWDGEERIRYALHHFLGAEQSEYSGEIMRFVMMGAISRVFKPGVKFDYMLCLVGEQAVGKSSFCRLLTVNDDWFTDDLRDLEKKPYEKLEGHWFIELSEMLATTNAKSNEAVKSFLTRQRETYRTPYEKYPRDRSRQCVFMGTTNKMAFLPNDRSGNRRFLPIQCVKADQEVFILDDEKASREYIKQMWAEAMVEYRKGKVSLKLSEKLQKEVLIQQEDFSQEDVDAGMILAYMQDYTGDKVCTKQLFREALHNENVNPQRWQTNEINEIMNQLIRDGRLTGWKYFKSPKRFGGEYGKQRGWERIKSVNKDASTDDDFMKVPDNFVSPFE